MDDVDSTARLEQLLASLMRGGTILATAVIVVGIALALVGAPSMPAAPKAATRIVAAGLLVFILLPAIRVAMMMVAFLRSRDRAFAAVAACVLAVIALGVVFASLRQA